MGLRLLGLLRLLRLLGFTLWVISAIRVVGAGVSTSSVHFAAGAGASETALQACVSAIRLKVTRV